MNTRSTTGRLPASLSRTEGTVERKPLLVPLWVSMGIAAAGTMLPFFGGDAEVLPALIFLTVCPLLVAAVLMLEGGDVDSDA